MAVSKQGRCLGHLLSNTSEQMDARDGNCKVDPNDRKDPKDPNVARAVKENKGNEVLCPKWNDKPVSIGNENLYIDQVADVLFCIR